eukprot:tig00000849_g4750.t1
MASPEETPGRGAPADASPFDVAAAYEHAKSLEHATGASAAHPAAAEDDESEDSPPVFNFTARYVPAPALLDAGFLAEALTEARAEALLAEPQEQAPSVNLKVDKLFSITVEVY